MKTEYTNDDSLKVTETGDGKFELEWDPNDPRWSWMNDLTNEELQVIVTKAIEEKVKSYVD